MCSAALQDRTIAGGRRVRRFDFASPAGRLEAVLFHRAEERPPAVAVFCQPHPQMGGTMHNKVAYRAAEAIFARGLPTLRFNFRGVGRSQGAWSGGEGEVEDAEAAVTCLLDLYPGSSVLLAGFSFGAGVALSLGARDGRVAGMLAVAPGAPFRDFSYLSRCPKPKAVVQGSDDELCPPTALQATYQTWAEPKSVRLVAGAGHFFGGRIGELAAAVQSLLGEPAMAGALGLSGEDGP